MRLKPSPFLIDINVAVIDKALHPVVKSVIADMKRDKLSIIEDDGNEQEIIARQMLRSLVEYALEHAIMLDVNEADIPFSGKPEVSCLEGRNIIVKKMLGNGSYGTVYAIDEKRAVKLFELPNRQAANEKKKAFQAEVDMGKKAFRLSVGPQVLDSYVCSARHKKHFGVIVMARIHGPDLQDWIKKASAAKITSMHAKVETLVAKMHKGGLFHNDLHAGNIIVAKGDQPVVVDFSFARSTPAPQEQRWLVGNNRHADFFILDRIKVGGEFTRGNGPTGKDSVTNLVRHVVRRAMTSGILRIKL